MDRYSLQGVLNVYTKRVSEEPDWGIEIANILIEKEDWENELWKSIFNGFKNSLNVEKNWERLFNLLLELDNLDILKREIANLLEEKIDNQNEAIPASLLEKADQLAEKLINELICENEKINTDQDWVTIAINRPAGKLSEFYLSKINRELKNSDQRVLKDHYKNIFDLVLKVDSTFANLFAVILVSQLHFLSGLDYKWVKEKLISRLRSENEQILYQAWSGFLVWGKWNAHILDDLFPIYLSFFKNVNSLELRLQESFCSHIASICVLSPIDPFKNDFLIQFIKSTKVEIHNLFSQKLKEYLKRTNKELHEEVWNDWLRKYLLKRKSGIPIEFSPQEVEDLMYLLVYMEGIIRPLHEFLMELDFPNLDHLYLYTELNESSMPNDYPEITARFLNKSLDATEPPFWDSKVVAKIVNKLLEGNYNKFESEIIGICNSLSRFGYSKASQLKNKISD